MYNVIEIIDGIKYTIYFFGSFSGMLHPFTPLDPIKFDEIGANGFVKYGSTVYVQGWYSETEKGPRLDKLLKYSSIGKIYEGEFEKSNVPGVYYHNLEKNNKEWCVKEALTLQHVFNKDRYLRYIINDEGKLESAYHIYSSLMGSYIYIYNKQGAVVNVDSKAYKTPTEIPDL